MRIFSSGDDFTATAVDNFDVFGWSVDSVSDTLVVMSGPLTNQLSLIQHFEGTKDVEGQDLAVSWAIFRDSGQTQNFTGDTDRGVFGGDGEYVGQGWWVAIPSDRWDPDDVQEAMMPLPAPLAMAGIGLLGVILGRKRLQRTAVG